MDKNAAIPSALIDFIAYATYILVIAAFFFLFTVKANTRTTDVIENDFAQVNGEQFLISYLATTVEKFEQNMTVAEFIVLSYEKNSYDELKEMILLDFSTLDKKGMCIGYLQLADSSHTLIPLDLWTSRCDKSIPRLVTSNKIILPTHNENKLCVSLLKTGTGATFCQ